MAGMTGGRNKRLVLDIGASAIRLAELARTKTGHQLVKYYQREFNSDPALDEEERKELIKILGLIEKGKAAIKDKPMHFEVLWLRPEAVLSYVRKLNLEEGFEQYLERIGQEASTRIKVVDEEEEEATETPQAAAQPSAQAPS